jgi:hypothetical protein
LAKNSLPYDPKENRSTFEFARNLARQGASDGEARIIFGNENVCGGLADNDAARVGGISDTEASRRASAFVNAELERAKITPSPTIEDPDQIVVTAKRTATPNRNGPSGSTITQKVFTGGAKLVEGLTQLQADHPIIAPVVYEAGKGLFTGGPIKTIVTKLAGAAISGIKDEGARRAEAATSSFVTQFAERNSIEVSLSVGGKAYSIGPSTFGSVAGQVAGGAVGVILDGGLSEITTRGTNIRGTVFEKYDVGAYKDLKGKVPGLDAHHVGQAAPLEKMIPGYDRRTGPAILVPSKGHTSRDGGNIVSKNQSGLNTPRDVVARDIRELRRVYPDIPNSRLVELISINKKLYPDNFVKGK